MTHHSRLVFNLSFLALTAVPPQIFAQSSPSGMANREIARRYARIEDARTAMDRGDKLFSEGDFEGALGSYKAAIDALPSAPLTRDWLDLAQLKYADCSVVVAREKAKQGKYDEARQLLEGAIVLVPGHKEALIFQKQLADPDRWPPALTGQHVENVAKVQKGLLLANSSVELGNYDTAITQYQDVLRTDPYNGAARRGMENAERKRMDYFKAAYDHQRAKMLAQVDEAWEDKVPVQGAAVVFDYGVGRSPGAYLTEKMNKIIFPTVQFQGATIEEAVEYLRVKSRDLDNFTDASGVKGVNIILRTGDAPSNASISLDLKDVPMSEALRYVTELAQMKYKVEAHAVLVVPLSEDASQQYTRTYRVPPDFLSIGGGDGGAAAPAAPADPFAAGGGGAAAGGGLIARKTAKQILEGQGIPFPEGSSASFNPATSQLIVRNTQPNLDLVEAFVDTITKNAPKMVVITSKFVEVTQKNTEELGFDWLLGGVGMNGNNLFLGGGSAGNGNAYSAGNYPFTTPYTSPAQFVSDPNNPGGTLQVFPPIPVNGAFAGTIPSGTTAPFPYGGGPITSGLRSGNFAINNNSIDNLLSTGSTTGTVNVAPGIFSMAGIFTDPQFQMVIRGLSQKKGVDLMSAPSVTTKSGTRATMEVTREFIYPTEFDPPQLPQGGGGGISLGGQQQSQIATPTTPTAFEMRQTGVRLEAEPTVGADGNTIELTLAPEVVEFDGFINYGSPILSPSSQTVLPIQIPVTNTGFTNPATTGYIPISQPERLITPNIINQPVFSVRKVTTGVSIWDGQTVALGGLIREDVQDVEDKIPILGDMPFIGRLFKTESELHYKRNLMIFVTAHLIDPSGQRVKANAPTGDAAGAGPGSVGTLLPSVAPAP